MLSGSFCHETGGPLGYLSSKHIISAGLDYMGTGRVFLDLLIAREWGDGRVAFSLP